MGPDKCHPFEWVLHLSVIHPGLEGLIVDQIILLVSRIFSGLYRGIDDSIGITAEQAAVVWACAARR